MMSLNQLRRSLAVLGVLTALTLRADPVDDYLRAEMEKRGIPGVAVAVLKDGQVIRTGAHGKANLELNHPAATGTVFEIGSVTKQITAAAMLLLVEEGKVNLDSRISDYLENTPTAWSNITVRHLLTHTSGIKNYTGLDGFEARRGLNVDSFVKEIGQYPLDFQPGDSYRYCNSGYSLLGHIIERASGQSYWEFLEARIFKPLGMSSARSRDLSSIIPERADGYEKKNGRVINRDSDLTDIFAAGAIVANITDMGKWAGAMDTGKLLNAASREAMWTPVKLNNGKVHPYGFGWRLDDHNGVRNIGHSGSTSGFSASLQRFPEDGLTVVVLTNTGEQIATALARGVARHYITRMPKDSAEPKP